MSNNTMEISHLQEIGQRLNTWGKYQILSFVLVFVGSLVFLGSYIANASTGYLDDHLINQFADALIKLAFFALVVILVEYFLVYKLVTAIKNDSVDRPKIDALVKSGNYFFYYLVVGILLAVYTLLNTMQLANSLRNTSNITYGQLTLIVATAENGNFIVLLAGILPTILLVLAIGKLVEYLNEIMQQQRFLDLQEARDKINTAKNGAMLLVLSRALTLASIPLIPSLLSLAGTIMVLYGIIKGGSLLKNFGNYHFGGMTPYTNPSPTSKPTGNFSSPTNLTPPLESIQNGNFCANCGTKNGVDAKFCTSCGAQM